VDSHKPTGWNTWDFRGFNRLVFLRGGRTVLALAYAIWDEDAAPPLPHSKQVGRLYDTFRWSDVVSLGPHAPLGLPARLDFLAAGKRFRAEATEAAGTLCVRVAPLAKTRLRIVFVVLAPVGETPDVHSPTIGTMAGWRITLRGANWPSRYFLNVAEPYAVAAPGRAASVSVGATLEVSTSRASFAGGSAIFCRGAASGPAAWPRRAGRGPSVRPPSADTVEAYERSALAGSGALADAPQAMMRAIAWNTLYDSRRRLVCTPVSRDWCQDWRGALVFCWDTFLVAGMAAPESPELARANYETALAPVGRLGMVPNYVMAHGAASLDRSMPPLGSYMIWKTEQARRDAAWLRRVYPALRRWHRYWMKHRDGNGDGLLEWGSGPAPRYEFPQLLPYNPSLQNSAKCAMYEAGLDNSPMYDNVPFNERSHTLELADVALNSYYAMDCESLSAIAARLGRPREAATFRREYEAVKRRVNEVLWDEQHGIYANRHWDGRFSSRWSPTSFFPLAAGIADARQAERLVREHLLNGSEFWGRYVIPSIARSDPAFADNDYWRGRIWGPLNFLVAQGLRRYRFDDAAADLGRRGLEMFLRNWRRDGGIYENYNAVTGQGGDVSNAARLYHWGGLMALIAIQELADVEADGCLRFGSVAFPNAGVRNVRIGDDAYDVTLGEGVLVRRGGRPFLECSVRAIVRLPPEWRPDAPVEISAIRGGRLVLRGLRKAGWRPRAALLNGAVLLVPRVGTRCTFYTWAEPAAPSPR
jgi:hypothetical protein